MLCYAMLKAKTASSRVIGFGGSYGASRVAEVRRLGASVPVFLCSILYWTVYCQMGSTFIEQGKQMDTCLAAACRARRSFLKLQPHL